MIRRPVVDPVLVRDDPLHGRTYSHPAYGMIGVARVQGNAVLTGTEFVHRAFVTIRVGHAEHHRTTARDWFFKRRDIVEVSLSEAQWATLVSSLNVGDGVPCTLTFVAGEEVPASLPHRTQTSAFKSEVAESMTDAVAKLRSIIAEVEQSTLGKRAKEEMVLNLKVALQEITQNLPFVEESFSKHVESTVEHAKVEVGAYVTGMLQRAGLDALGHTAPITMIEHDNE